MKQGFLFTDDAQDPAPLFIPQTDDAREWGEFASLTGSARAFENENRCTLDGKPARIIGTPRSAAYAAIEPVDLDTEPMRCCWDVVHMVMQDGGAFCRDDDDTDE